MPPDENLEEPSPAALAEIDRKLAELIAAVGYRDPPDDDAVSTRRWQMPVYAHLSHLSDSMHVLRNVAQVMTGLADQLRRSLSQSQAISQQNNEAIARVELVVHRIEEKTEQFRQIMGRAEHEKPFLMRDLYWVETDGFEALLIFCAIGEAAYFLVGSEALRKSVLFQGLAVICPYSLPWGLGWAALASFGAVAFFSRRKILRNIAAGYNFFYFAIIGGAPILFSSGGALGTWHHYVFCVVAAWIVSRGPSNAI